MTFRLLLMSPISASLVMAAALLVSVPAIDGQQLEQASDQSEASAATSPAETIAQLATHLAAGDVRQTEALFLADDAIGKQVQRLYGLRAQYVASLVQLQQTTERRFGQEGLRTVNETFDVIDYRDRSARAARQRIARDAKIFINQEDETEAVILLPPVRGIPKGPTWVLKRVEDRWYIDGSQMFGQDASAEIALSIEQLQEDIRRFQAAHTVVQTSKSADQLREQLERFETVK